MESNSYLENAEFYVLFSASSRGDFLIMIWAFVLSSAFWQSRVVFEVAPRICASEPFPSLSHAECQQEAVVWVGSR